MNPLQDFVAFRIADRRQELMLFVVLVAEVPIDAISCFGSEGSCLVGILSDVAAFVQHDVPVFQSRELSEATDLIL